MEPESDMMAGESDAGTTDAGGGAMSEPEANSEPTTPTSCMSDPECLGSLSCQAEECVNPFECAHPEVTGAATISVPVSDTLGGPLPGIPARLCRNIDPQCDSPLAELETDMMGVLHVEVPEGTAGYLEFIVESFFPQLLFLPDNLVDGTELPNVALSPAQLIEVLALNVQTEPDPERGHLHMTIINCYGEKARGVELSSLGADDETVTYYVEGGVPTDDLEATAPGDSGGAGGFLNFPPGFTAINLADSATHENFSRFSVVIRAGFLSTVVLQPSLQ